MTADGLTASRWVNYHAGNLRIQTVQWDIPAGMAIYSRIWWNGALVVDEVHVGPEQSTANVPGNRSMVEVTDASGTYLDFPAELTYSFGAQRV